MLYLLKIETLSSTIKTLKTIETSISFYSKTIDKMINKALK